MMYATYSAEDNKLRLYSSSRLDNETYQRVKAAGFKWAPKQELFVAPAWTPYREDLLIDLCGEIEDEDYSATERAADRAERFETYRDKRAAEAGVSADVFESGPSAFGHQNRARAERQAARHDRYRTRAVSQWSKAEYWQERTRAVISHALYKSSAAVRRSRILRLEAEQRKHEKSREEYAERFAKWQKVLTLDGADMPVVCANAETEGDPYNSLYGIRKDLSPAGKLAYTLANYGSSGWNYKHPRTGRETSLYSLLTDADPITPREAAQLWLDGKPEPTDPESYSARWSDHYNNRLTYERAMLAEEGGTAGDAEMEPGGWVCTGNRTGSVFTDIKEGWKQIQSVNKSPATGKVVSVKVWGTSSGYTRASNYKEYATVPALVTVNVERLPEGAYRAPTDEERKAFAEEKAARKAQEKATKPKAPALVNPTDEDAERLQALWNKKAKEAHDKTRKDHYCMPDYIPTVVRRMTQAEYSAKSKGAYASCETVDVCENGQRPRRWDDYKAAVNPPVAFKVRKTYGGTGFTSSAHAVIVITDKPQKPLPLDWAAIEAGTVEPASTVAV